MPIPSKSLPEKPKTAKERVYSQVREWIINGTLQPDERISDQEISYYFSVSRTPVREAMQLLADQKLVTVYPGKETRVSPIDLKEAGQNYRIMAELQSLAVELTYPHITPQTIDQLKRINKSFAIAVNTRDIENIQRFDDQFHDIFLHEINSYFMSEFTKILKSHLQRIEILFYKEKEVISSQTHEEIIAALENQDLKRAKDAMRNNWLYTLEKIKK
ncbi:FCD domain-containing protein [Clostridium sp. MCC353]|uniref:GntR family transcriptional regulator n=1 Tax=Clostridium sp. MCC353 TaxID=2592646 RepID=UPI001C033C5B|nr:GntR family transcriptional regulator [Clostridium sp. MCC353]MBT9775683.1 FCD domain-containing protein [Clostridium sp. MCC353]